VSPWFEKYAPNNLKELLGQRTLAITNHALRNPKAKALLVHGPAGVGKTCSIHALAKSEGYELVEVNASSLMNAEAVKSIIGNASLTMSLFGKRVILVDDVDSLSSSDRGGITELIKCVKATRTPIFLTAIDLWDKKLRSLRGYCELVEFKKVSASTIRDLLKSICSNEGVVASDSVLYSIAMHANGDVRAAINNLEMLSGDGEVTEFELEAMGYRQKPVSIFNGLQTLFKTTNFNEAVHSLDDVNLDFSTKLLWITENIPNEFSMNSELANAFNALSRSDVFNGRIKREQYWRFLFYVNTLMTAGVNVSREVNSGFVKYSKPTKILKLWKSKSRRELRKQLALKFKSAVKASLKKTVQEVLPYIKFLARNKDFVSHYELTADEIGSI